MTLKYKFLFLEFNNEVVMKIYQNIEANIRDINKEEILLLNLPAPDGLLLDHGVSFHVSFHFLKVVPSHGSF